MLRILTVSVLLLASAGRPAAAQLISAPGLAEAARTSLLARADTVRQQIQELGGSVTSRAKRRGARRIVVRGYYVDGALERGKRRLAWRHITVYRRTGSTRELFIAFQPSTKAETLTERRHNGQLTWLKLQHYQPLNTSYVPSPRRSGYYAAGRYVRWNGQSFLLPATTIKP